MISQKVDDGFGWNLVNRLGVWQGRISWFDCGEDLNPDLDSIIFMMILYHWEMRQKTMFSMLTLKVVDDLWQNEVEELVRWQEKAGSILVKVWNEIQLISDIQNVNYSACRRYVLYSAMGQIWPQCTTPSPHLPANLCFSESTGYTEHEYEC